MEYKAIYTVVNKGMADKVLKCAKIAGSKGGTVIQGMNSGVTNSEKFFNKEIEQERDIVLTLSNTENTDKIVESIKETIGIGKDSDGIIFILDVSNVTGINDHE